MSEAKKTAKLCSRCGKAVELRYNIKIFGPLFDHGRPICAKCRSDIKRFINGNYRFPGEDVPIRYDIISIHGDRFIREDLIVDLRDKREEK